MCENDPKMNYEYYTSTAPRRPPEGVALAGDFQPAVFRQGVGRVRPLGIKGSLEVAGPGGGIGRVGEIPDVENEFRHGGRRFMVIIV